MNNKLTKIAIATPILFALLFVSLNESISLEANVMADPSFGGLFTITHADANGNIISVQKVHNLVTNEGLECFGDLIFEGTAVCVSENTFSYLAVGTTATAPADSQTALIAESGGCARVQDGTVALDTSTTGQREATVSSVFSGGSCEAESYVETGIFDASSSGNMLARATFSSINLGVGETLTINYEIVINNA